MENSEIFAKQCELIAKAFPHFMEVMNKHTENTESPIEALFLSAINLKMQSACDYEFVVGNAGMTSDEFNDWMTAEWSPDRSNIFVAPQLNYFGVRRMDFMVGTWDQNYRRISICVECDGFEWHDKDKVSFEKYRYFDREMLTSGLDVLRFAGTEIWNDATDCVDRLVAHIEKVKARRFAMYSDGWNDARRRYLIDKKSRFRSLYRSRNRLRITNDNQLAIAAPVAEAAA